MGAQALRLVGLNTTELSPVDPPGLAAPNDLSGDTVYAATWLGVYRTIDGSVNWSQFGASLPTVKVSDLYMPADGSFLRASTYGRGVWDLPLN